MKKLLLFILSITFSYALNAQAPSGAIAEYRFSGGSLLNSADPGNGNLTPSNSGFQFRSDRDGNANSALRNLQRSFDGISIPATASNPVNRITVSLWHLFENPIVGASDEGVFQIFDSNNKGIQVYKGSSGWGLRIYESATSFNEVVLSDANLFDNTNFHHILIDVVPVGASGFQIRGFLDGNLLTGGATTNLNGTLFSSNANFTLSPVISSFGLRSSTDDIRIYTRTLSQTEINQLANESGQAAQPLSRVYVDASSPTNLGGNSWSNAVQDVDQAIALAAPGAEIWVKAGTYKKNSGTNLTPVVSVTKQVSILGGFDGSETMVSERDPVNNITIFSGDKNNNDSPTLLDNSTRSDNNTNIFLIEADNVVLDGIWITDAQGGDSVSSLHGSGAIFMKNTQSNLTVRNCVIEKNLARFRGSVLLYEPINVGTTNIIFDRCIIRNNLTAQGGITLGARINTNLTVEITNSLFLQNRAEDLAGNTTPNYGSSIFTRVLEDGGQVKLDMINNTIVSGTDVTGTTVIVSQPQNDDDFEFNIYNSVFNNTRTGGSLNSPIGVAGLTTRVYTIDANSNITDVTFTNIPDTNETNTIINANPGFIDSSSNGDFRPTSSSIMVNAGNSNFNSTSLDLDGNPRIFGGSIDIGAYEFGSTLSVNDFIDQESIKLYPNPAKNAITILSSHNLKKVIVYSVLGREILRSTQKSINIQHLKAGVYLIKVEMANGRETVKKFIKE